MARNTLNSGNQQAEELPKAKINSASIGKISELLRYLKPYRSKFIFGVVFLFLSRLTGLAFPSLLGAMIDAAQGKQKLRFLPADINTIGWICFMILFVQAFVSFFRIRFFVEVAEKALADIRRDTYFRLITLPMNFFANRRVGELNSRLSADLSQIQDTLTTTLAELFRQVVLLIGGVTLLFVVSYKLTLLNLAILPILVIAAVIFGRFIRKISRQAQDQLAESNTVVQETLQGIANVKAFVNEAYEAQRYEKNLKKVVQIALKGATYRGAFASFIIFCLFGAIVGVIWYGSALVAMGQLSVGSLTTFILYAIFVGAAMGSFPELYANVQKAVGASERVLEILHEQNETISIDHQENEIKQVIKGNLEFKDLSFNYPSRPEMKVLQSVNLEAKAGDRVAIVGPSGAGKSTIASLILRFYDPQSGEVLFDGKASSSYS